MKFYSVVLKKKLDIPDSKIRNVVKANRRWAVGKYKVGKKEYEAWRVLGMAKGYKKKK